MLEVVDLDAHYGGVCALRSIRLDVAPASVVALLGANGAGKTTLLNAIVGGGQARLNGTIRFEGKDLMGATPADTLMRGIALCPEGRQLFGELTVRENLLMGAYSRTDRDAVAVDLEAMHVLFPRLAQRTGQKGATLSGGEQQMVALARALMSAPKLLLLDEPSLGLAPVIVKEVMTLVRKISDRDVTVLLVEQNIRQALKTASRAFVLERGAVALSGRTTDLLKDERVLSAYLGGSRRLQEET